MAVPATAARRQYRVDLDDASTAIYDLARYPVNFNFIEFLVASASLGAKYILLDHSKGVRPKYSMEETMQRLHSIIEPACALAGCTYEYGSGIGGGSGLDVGYHLSAVLEVYRHMPIKKLTSVLPAKTNKYTVTLRNSDRYAERNGNEKAWLDFAERIGATVIPDYTDNPIHLHDRMAYYAGAKMNYFVGNGPASLCLFSDYPYTVFMSNVDDAYCQKHGFWLKQLPWANNRQKLVWAQDTEENINREAPDG